MSLMAKIGADITGFMAAMGKIKAAAAPAGKQIHDQLRGKVLEAFGVGGAISMVKSQLQRAREIDIGSSSLGVDTSTFQALQRIAERSGVSMESLVEEMNSGSAAGRDFADAVAAVREEMESTGQLIDQETLSRINAFNDKMSQLFGRLAPGLAMIVDFLGKLYAFGERIANFAVGLGMTVYGQFTGQSQYEQGGLDTMEDAFNGVQDEASLSGIGDAVDRARQIRKHNKSGGSSSSGSYRPLDVSAATSVGGYRNPMFSMSAENWQAELRAMNSNLRDINASLRRGVE